MVEGEREEWGGGEFEERGDWREESRMRMHCGISTSIVMLPTFLICSFS